MSAPESLRIVSNSFEQTEQLGSALMELLPNGSVVGLFGDLGSGKTCFVRGMANAIGAGGFVTSPTFTLVHEYRGARMLYHLDLYRIAEPNQVEMLGYEDLFEPRDGVTVIEWAERAAGLMPERRVDVRFAHATTNSRDVEIENRGVLSIGWERRVDS